MSSGEEDVVEAFSMEWPTEEDNTFFEKFAKVEGAEKMIRNTTATLKLPPCKIVFQNMDQLPKDRPLDHHAARIFDIFIKNTLKKANGDLTKTKYWLNLQHPAYTEKDGFWIMHKTYKLANGHTLMNIIAKHNQSKPELAIDQDMVLSMRIFKEKDMTGRGNRLPDIILKKFGMKRPNVLGNTHCLPKAIAIGRAWSDMNSLENDAQVREEAKNKFRSLTRSDNTAASRSRVQMDEAVKLLSGMDMDTDVIEHNQEDLITIAEHLPNYIFRVWSVQPGIAVPTVTFEANKNADGLIPLFFHDGHYEFFNPTCASVNVRYCFKCRKFAKQDHWKKCAAKCSRCGSFKCEPTNEMRSCEKCNIWFHSVECYTAHLEKANVSSLPCCDKYEKCTECFVIHKRESYCQSEHVCFQTDFCKICKRKISGNHQCVHAPITEATRKRNEKRQESWRILAYDCETIVSSTAEYTGTSAFGEKHVPNVLAYKMFCNECLGNYCQTCGDMQVLSYKLRPGESGTVLERFVKFIKTDKRLENSYIIAHNGGRYDHVFVLEALLRNENYTPKFIMSGSTFVSVTVRISKNNTLHFLDSVKFMPMRLAQLPSAFQLETESKGHFPYMFNHPDNYGCRLDTLPPIAYYQPKFMSVVSKKEFEQWYEENYESGFDFDEEIVKYCKNDVQILTEALVKFIKICQDSFANWNPIIQSTTIASYIMHVLKHEHIKKSIVGYIPEAGYAGRNNSVFALKFLLWKEHENPGMVLKHKLRKGGEHSVSCRQFYAVDGYDPETGHIYEIHGCMYHGCPRCYLNREQKSPHDKNKTMAELYDETISKENDIRNFGHTLHVFWECDLREEIRRNKKMARFFNNCNYAHQLRPREAMYGGRTQQFKSLVTADGIYTLEYYDFCSLYPSVNIRGIRYPIGVPTQITEESLDAIVHGEPLPYMGLAFCDILPPTNCKIPVLPLRVDSKLIFPLCRSCAISKEEVECTHFNASERYLTGVWCTDEINLAIREGYKLLKYHEVWHWPEDQWFRGGFFEEFMSPLLKMKHEASGWPEDVVTDADRQEHIRKIFEDDNVMLDEAKVSKNPALRSLAKLFLNSTWGKFAQNPVKTETRLILNSKGQEICDFFDDQGYEPKCFIDWGDNHVLVSRKPLKDAANTSYYSNIVYGALTTCGARIQLYEAMKRVGAENLIYCDTDSIIFRQKIGEDLLGDLKGEAIGKMTREVPRGWNITEIVAMAAKVYAYKMVDAEGNEKCITKAKGITLNTETANTINFETMKQLMIQRMAGVGQEFSIRRMRMKRGRDILDGLHTVMEEKRLRPVMDKGIFSATGEIIPFGTITDDNVVIEDDYEFY